MLLNCPQTDLRNPAEALRLAEQASRQTGGRHPEFEEVLAAALAANGAFDQAIAAAQRAAELARMQNRPDLLARITEAAQAYHRQRDGTR